jgi:hypothetical protein
LTKGIKPFPSLSDLEFYVFDPQLADLDLQDHAEYALNSELKQLIDTQMISDILSQLLNHSLHL